MSKRSGARNYGGAGRSVVRCYHCSEEGHIAKNCPNKPPQLCFNCGKPGHIKRDCPQPLAPAPSRQHVHAPRGERTAGKETALLVEVTGLEHERERPDKNASSPPPTAAASSVARVNQRVVVPRPFLPAAEPSTHRDLKSAKFIDTHCHLEYVFERFKHQGSFAEFMDKHGYPENYEGCITTFCDPTAFSPSFGIWQSLLSERNVWGTFGTHPHNAKYYHSSSLEEKMLKCIAHPKCVAVGEIGLDYASHSPSDPDTQKKILSLQLQLAVRLKKPIILHCRNAEEDMFAILVRTVPTEWPLHLHCFTGTLEMARKFIETFQNLYIGVCGNVTYDSTSVQAIASTVPLERLLLETDAPYMVPRNLPKQLSYKFSHPSLAFYTAKQIAQIRHMNIVDVLKALRENTRAMYGI